MIINPGMLIFALLDSGIAFLLVFFVVRARFGGIKSTLARSLAAVLGTIVFVIYFAILVWFNIESNTINQAGKNVVYAAPIVLSILMCALTLLSQPPKKAEQENTETTDESATEETVAAEENE